MQSSRSGARHVRPAPWLLVGALVTLAFRSLAADGTPPVDARGRFDRGVELYNNGDLDQALLEFDLAHRLQPHFAVLYNLGLTQAALGHSVDAVRTFRRYLQEGAERLDAGRRKQVEATILLHEKRLGRVEFKGDLSNVECELDGLPVDCASEELLLVVGRHVVVAKREGYTSLVQTVAVRSRATAAVTIALQPNRLERSNHVDQQASTSWFRVGCAVPDVVVELDGTVYGKTPLGDWLHATSGRHTVRFVRSGYQTTKLTLDLVPGPTNEVDCDLRPTAPLGSTQSGLLLLEASERDARLWVDGVRFAGQRLPSGAHRVQAQASGFLPWTKEVAITPTRPTRVVVDLVPTPEMRTRYESVARFERTLAYVAGASGIAAGAAAIGLCVYSAERIQYWQAARTQLAADVASGIGTDQFGQRMAQLNDDEATIVRVDAAALALGVLSGAMLATATGLIIWGKDPGKYSDRRSTPMTTGAVTPWAFRW